MFRGLAPSISDDVALDGYPFAPRLEPLLTSPVIQRAVLVHVAPKRWNGVFTGTDMLDLSTWHWLIVFGFVAIPLFAVAIFISKKRVEQREFLYWTLGWLGVLLAVEGYVALGGYGTIGIVPALVLYSFWFFFVRRITGRTLDAGYSKAVAFLSFIPVVNVIYILVLLFTPTRAEPMADEHPSADVKSWQNN